ncbi:MAG: secondary thiamine-phosphate synthase enzyme YjbQ [Thermodesulfobacteriota bacterium]|nr:secondary thiamine-phosphate synthase enzyme YjbQ [Thermodesulfobacteriota bacterium]
MGKADIICQSLEVRFNTGIDIRDITEVLSEFLSQSSIADGVLSAFMTGSTGSLTTIEYEPGVVEDLKRVINEIAPPGRVYEHEKAWHDGNGHSHVQAALLGPSISIAVRDGRMQLGTWQQVVAINHDNRARNRTIEVTITGTPA